MKIKSLVCSSLLIAAGSVYAPAALAQNNNWYAGVSAGYADVDLDVDGITTAMVTTGLAATAVETDSDDGQFSGGVFVGYQVNPYVGVEASYNYLGEAEFDIATTGPTGALSDDVSIHAFSLDVVGTVPINDMFSVFGRVGVFYWSADQEATFTVPVGATGTFGEDDDGTDFKFGVGAAYKFNDAYSMRVEYQRFELSDAETNLYQASLVYNF